MVTLSSAGGSRGKEAQAWDYICGLGLVIDAKGKAN